MGRLQYGFGQAKYDIPEKGIQKGMLVLDVHIPAGEPLNIEVCEALSCTNGEKIFVCARILCTENVIKTTKSCFIQRFKIKKRA